MRVCCRQSGLRRPLKTVAAAGEDPCVFADHVALVRTACGGVLQRKRYCLSLFSPFGLGSHFCLHLPDDKLRILIDDQSMDGQVLVSTLTGQRCELTFSNLAKFHFSTLKDIGEELASAPCSAVCGDSKTHTETSATCLEVACAQS